MKVRVIKLDERYAEFITEEERQRVGKVFEALEYNNNFEKDEKYQKMYALGLEDGIWFLPTFCCKIVEEGIINNDVPQPQINNPHSILMVEDGSVDVDKLENDGFYVIVYRQGAVPPMWLK